MMRSYLKYRPAWAQLAIFLLFTIGFALMAGMVGNVIVAKINGISITTLQDILNGKQAGHTAARNVIAGSQIVQFLAIFIIPSALFAWMADPKPVQFAGLQQPSANRYYGTAIMLVLCSLYLVGFLTLLNKQIPLPQVLTDIEARQNASIKTLAVAGNLQQLFLSVFIIGILAAVGEELFFRAILQRILIQLFKSPWAGIIVASALFSALHMQFSGFLPRMGLGMALGALYWYSGSIWPGILFHFLYNSLGVIMVYNRPEMLNQDVPVASPLTAIYILGLLSTAAVIYLVLQMKKHSTTNYAQVYPKQEPTPFDPVV